MISDIIKTARAAALLERKRLISSSGIGSQFTFLNYVRGVNQQGSNGQPVVSDPYDGNLTYIQQGGAITVEVNPVGARNLTALVPKVTEIHCHNCPLITSLTCTNDNLLTVLDLAGCPALETLVFNDCGALPSVVLDSSFVTMTSINFESCSSLASFIADSVTTVSGSVTFRSLTGGSHFNVTSFSMSSLVSTGGNFFFYPGSGEPAQPGPATLSFPDLVSVSGYFIVAANTSLTSLSVPSLTTVNSDFNIGQCTLLTSINADSLSYIGGILYLNSSPAITSVSFPSLTYAGYINIFDNTLLETVDLGVLTTMPNNLTFTGNPSLLTIDLSSLEQCYGITANSLASLTSISLPSLQNGFVPSEIYLNDCPSLGSFSIDIGLEAQEGGFYHFYNSGLDQSSVDLVFQFGINGGTSAAEYLCDGGTNSTPSLAGIANATTLSGLGNNVTYNP